MVRYWGEGVGVYYLQMRARPGNRRTRGSCCGRHVAAAEWAGSEADVRVQLEQTQSAALDTAAVKMAVCSISGTGIIAC